MSGFNKQYTLWNFDGFTSINLASGAGFLGTILAVDADINGYNGQIEGSVFGNSFGLNHQTPTIQLDHFPFLGIVFAECLPTGPPTHAPTLSPTNSPTLSPTNAPTNSPTLSPTKTPTNSPTQAPTSRPTPVCVCELGMLNISMDCFSMTSTLSTVMFKEDLLLEETLTSGSGVADRLFPASPNSCPNPDNGVFSLANYSLIAGGGALNIANSNVFFGGLAYGSAICFGLCRHQVRARFSQRWNLQLFSCLILFWIELLIIQVPTVWK
jgi:hypothetical protein